MREPGEIMAAFPRPGRALKAVLTVIAVFAVAGAIIVNWAPGGETGARLFTYLTFDPGHPLSRPWGVLTSGLLTSFEGISHALWSLFGLYILTPDLDVARDFYVAHFGFRVVFEADWYVQLHAGERSARPVELALMWPQLDAVPPPLRPAFSGEGMILTIEVDDVDAAYRAMDAAGALSAVVVELTDEAWGQRHFLIRDPAGVLLDVVQPIAPSEEYAAAYQRG